MQAQPTQVEQTPTPTLGDFLESYDLVTEECSKAKREAVKFAEKMILQPYAQKRWLTLCGVSGVGKTHIAENIISKVRELKPNMRCQMWKWIDVVNLMRKGDYGIIDHLCMLDFVVIDDIGASYESELSKAKLFEISERRLRKWTLWTSNLLLNEIGAQIDVRLSSRMVRGESRLSAFRSTPDYCLANYK